MQALSFRMAVSPSAAMAIRDSAVDLSSSADEVPESLPEAVVESVVVDMGQLGALTGIRNLR